MKSVIAILFIFISQLSFSQNIIQNGNFENADANWILIDSDSGASVNIDNSIFFQGNSSIKLEISNTTTNITAGIYQSVNITQNTTYLFSYAIKTENVDLYAFPFFKFNNGTDYFVTKSFVSGRTKDWTIYSMRITAPPNVNQLDFYFFLTGNEGKIWVDEINLSGVPITETLNFTVDFNSVTGTFNSYLMGTNSSPITPTSANNLTAKFQEIGITGVRTHDIYGSCDIHLIFPDFSADPLNPNSYDFNATDNVMQSIVNSNATPFFRLGETYDGTANLFDPPNDFDKWATICLQIVKHYNAGWNNGFYYNIEKWEVWNEPDLSNYWTGTPQQFYDLYQKTAIKIKNFDSNLKIGAAGFAYMNNTKFVDSFLDSISTNSIPIDFISYHSYNFGNPYYYAIQEQNVQTLLSNYGLSGIETYLTEWNNYEYNTETTLIEYGRDDALSAALTASSYYYLQNSSLKNAYRYRTDEYFFGLFRSDGAYSYSGLALRTIGNFIENNQWLETTGSDTLGSVCMAGKSITNDKFGLVIANPNKPSNSYSITIQNLTDDYNYQIVRIDNNNEFVVVANGVVSPSTSIIQSNVTPPYVDYISFDKVLSTNSLINPTEESVVLYPNPASGMLNIKTKVTSGKIEIYTISGKKVLTTNNQPKIDISTLSSGIYLLRIKSDKNIETKKFVIIE